MSTSTATISKPLPPAHVFSAPKHYRPHNDIPNTHFMVSFISTILGSVALTSFLFAVMTGMGWMKLEGSLFGDWARPVLGAYLGCLAMFHLGEFWVTAIYNPERISVDAFLLNNGKAYHIAHLFGILEYLFWSHFWPRKNWWYMQSGWIYLALPILVAAQALRSFAMIHAAESFSHQVSRGRKAEDHTLVTHGVYQISRHPSYTGFFYWALASQVMLGNIVSPIGFAYVLGKFFSARIIDEEIHLVRFFGQDYVDFRSKVGTWLPAGLVAKGAR